MSKQTEETRNNMEAYQNKMAQGLVLNWVTWKSSSKIKGTKACAKDYFKINFLAVRLHFIN